MTSQREAEQYLCLRIEEFPAQAMLRLRPELRVAPCAILAGKSEDGAAPESVCSLNRRAHALGIRRGMTRVEAGVVSSVMLLPRSRAEEAQARTALLECAGTFSPRIEDRTRDKGAAFLAVLDIGGTEKLFGSPYQVGRLLLDRMQSLGFTARIAISSSFHAAICLVRGMPPGYSVAVIPAGEESRALASLPLRAIEMTEEQTATFSSWGIRTLGMLAALPENALIARLGQEGRRLRQLARGCRPHLFRPMEPPFHLEERREMESPVESLESLLFSISAMLERLTTQAEERSLALASVTATLFLEGGRVYPRTIHPALPSNDRQTWIRLFHLDLEAHPAGAAVLALQLTASPGSTSKVQLGLFAPQLPEPARLDVTMARIRAIVGEGRAGRAVLQDTYRPDSFEIMPFTIAHGSGQTPAPDRPRVAMRRLRPPEQISVSLRSGRPEGFFFHKQGYDVEHAYGPWILSGGWWGQESWDSEQWDITACRRVNGWGTSRLCCQMERERRNCWRMVAIYD